MQTKVGEEESELRSNPSEPVDCTETFAQETLGGKQELHNDEHKVLGVTWNVSSDHFDFSLTELAKQTKNLEPTKRDVVSVIGRFFDPLVFLAPVVVKFTIFMQSLCEARIGWDVTLPRPLMSQWSNLVADLAEAQPLSIPRCYLEGIQGEVTVYRLSGYCNASLSAYAAVIYLWMETERGGESFRGKNQSCSLGEAVYPET